MKKRKQPVPEDQVIYDLSDLVEFHTTKVLYDGSKRKRATLYLVKVRAVTETACTRNTIRDTPACNLYVLKIV
jgi:hypothetical protein